MARRVRDGWDAQDRVALRLYLLSAAPSTGTAPSLHGEDTDGHAEDADGHAKDADGHHDADAPQQNGRRHGSKML